MYTIDTSDKHHTSAEFDTLQDIRDYLARLDDAVPRSQQRGCTTTVEAPLSYDKTLQALETGGLADIPTIEPLDFDTSELALSDEFLPRMTRAVVGYRPDVPAYLSGAPECMIRQTPTLAVPRVVKIGIDVTSSWYITAAQIENRGAAVLGVVDALTAAGLNVDLTAYISSREGHTLDNRVTIQVPVKHVSEGWDVAKASLVLTSASFTRRVGFNLKQAMSVLDKSYPARLMTAGGMGRGAEVKPEGVDVWFDWIRDRNAFDTPERARQQIIEACKKQYLNPVLGVDDNV